MQISIPLRHIYGGEKHAIFPLQEEKQYRKTVRKLAAIK